MLNHTLFMDPTQTAMTALDTIHAEEQRYPLFMELGFLLALLTVTLLFRIPFQPSTQAVLETTVEQEIVHIEEIEVTRQIAAPPPAPALPPPVEVPDEQIVEDVILPSVELDVNATLTAPPPPPPPAPRAAAQAPPPVAAPPPEPEIFEIVEQMPEIVGGTAAIQPEYPEIERMAGIEGRVFVQFVVNEDGRISDVVVIRGVSAGLDAAAVAALRNLEFIPGRQRGRAVKVKMAIPITFRLRN